MNNRLRIYATGTCDGLSETLQALAAHEDIELLGSSESIADAAASLTGANLDLLLHGTRQTSFPTDELASIREYTTAPVILVAAGDCSGMLDAALEAGVSDVLELPKDNVIFAIRKACQIGRRERHATVGRVITIFCPKGGVGKSTTSVNLAVALAKFHRKRTLLLDLDLQFGDTAIMLGLEPETTIYDLMVAPGELDAEKLAGYTTRHPSGVDIVPAPLRPEEAELVTEQKIARAIDVARNCYDVVVVDTPPFFHGPMLSSFDRTDDLLLLCGTDVPTIKNVRMGMQTLQLLTFPKDRIRLVLNRANTKGGINRGEIERALESKVRFELPADPAVTLAVNQGKPVVLSNAKAPFSQAIRQLANALAGGEAAAKHRPRLLARARA